MNEPKDQNEAACGGSDLTAELGGWLPIETAPRDKRVLVWSGQEMYCAHWSQNPMTGDEAWIVAEWGTDGDQALVKPTHWQTLPLPPNAEVSRGAQAQAKTNDA